MKKYKKYISLVISFIIFMLPLKVSATGSFDGFTLNGTYSPDNGQTFQAYTYDDGNGSDAALPNGFKYYYKFSDGKVGYFDRADVIGNILNTKIGIVMEPLVLAQFIADYGSGIVGRNPNYYNTLKPVLKGGVLVGVALNSLTGGVIETIGNNNPNVSIPNTEVNNVYNFYLYWSELPEHKQLPEYITIKGQSKAYFSSLVSDTTSTEYKVLANASIPYFGGMRVNLSNNKINASNGVVVYCPAENTYTTLDGFASFCNDVGLTLENRTITWDELTLKTFSGTYIRQVNKSNFTANSNWVRYTSETPSTNSAAYQTWGGSNGTTCIVIAGDITLWRNTTVVSQIINNTYKPNIYTTNNYKNYNTGNDNSYTTTYNNVSNGSSSNSTVYNETNTSNNTNITNQITSNDNSYSYVDNSSVITNTTTIVNNYYNTNYPENPDDPNDNPSGGGSGSDLENDGILDGLLAAILRLLRAIGKIISTILQGIIEIIADVLEAIASITTSFTGIIGFISNIFGFLPSEAIAVLTLGLTISVLIALLKMFGK